MDQLHQTEKRKKASQKGKTKKQTKRKKKKKKRKKKKIVGLDVGACLEKLIDGEGEIINCGEKFPERSFLETARTMPDKFMGSRSREEGEEGWPTLLMVLRQNDLVSAASAELDPE